MKLYKAFEIEFCAVNYVPKPQTLRGVCALPGKKFKTLREKKGKNQELEPK